MRPAYLTILLLSFAACVGRQGPSTADRTALDAVETAWGVSADLPAPGDCLARVEVRRHDSRASYVDECEGMAPGAGGREHAQMSAGCLTSDLRGMAGKKFLVINIAPEYHNDMGLVQHEALHALIACVLDRPATDPWDSGHTDPRVWSGAGGAASVEARAK